MTERFELTPGTRVRFQAGGDDARVVAVPNDFNGKLGMVSSTNREGRPINWEYGMNVWVEFDEERYGQHLFTCNPADLVVITPAPKVESLADIEAFLEGR